MEKDQAKNQGYGGSGYQGHGQSSWNDGGNGKKGGGKKSDNRPAATWNKGSREIFQQTMQSQGGSAWNGDKSWNSKGGAYGNTWGAK